MLNIIKKIALVLAFAMPYSTMNVNASLSKCRAVHHGMWRLSNMKAEEVERERERERIKSQAFFITREVEEYTSKTIKKGVTEESITKIIRDQGFEEKTNINITIDVFGVKTTTTTITTTKTNTKTEQTKVDDTKETTTTTTTTTTTKELPTQTNEQVPNKVISQNT